MGHRILGIDAGAVSLSLAEVDEQGTLLQHESRAHEGEIPKTLEECLKRFGPFSPDHVVATTSTPTSIRSARRVDSLVAAVRAARVLHPGLGALLVVGGERFSLSLFEPDGRYRESRFNSLCAAGTGSFLDQQARRLGLTDSATLARMAMDNEGDRPRIATRCAVFAKTDLIHAQQEGYTREAICDGLCRGLAANVHDALFTGQPIPEPIVFAGGVALNSAVVRHMADLLGHPLTVDEAASVYGAYGAALDWIEARKTGDLSRPEGESEARNDRVAQKEPEAHKTYFPPLGRSLGTYPSFVSHGRSEFLPKVVPVPGAVEVDVYRPVQADEQVQVLLGLDVGSTSTKAVLLEAGGESGSRGDEGVAVLAGFYTRTAGRPLLAVQAIFEAVEDWVRAAGFRLQVLGAGTTGSGRKFIGALVGADLVLDEISAHARAAVQLDPEVDTIIEIGGQDAKFTTLQNGTVTQSVMNHVCAAGTGSFIEEQAQRLGCDLRDMAARTAGQRAPLASDRCTVFMERDINHFLSDGYQVDEVLCSVLHAVRDNYLLKVAREGSIGRRICFQGATAKNQSLVAAFEQKLERPIQVSRYCHLTGALGVALDLRDQVAAGHLETTGFRGLDLYAERIPVESEICDLCHNQCKLRLAEIRGERVGFGYLCGRDPEEEQFVSANRSGFDLLKAHRRHFRVETGPADKEVRIGLPAALHMVQDLPLWKKFFAELGVRTLTSERLANPVGEGKRLANAEFCAPVAAWHAHVASLRDRVDYVFAPIYLEAEHPRGDRRQYCYYTQYAPSLAAGAAVDGLADKCLMPLLHIGERTFGSWAELHKSLSVALGEDLKRSRVVKAYERAVEWFEERQSLWPQVMKDQLEDHDDLAVVLLGRPYTVLSPRMNSGIPELLAKQGIKAFYQDMLEPADLTEIEGLVRAVRWDTARRMLVAAEAVAQTPGLYPILITSFKCTPDACTLEYFRRVMNAHGKPYLVLQLDEHDSQVGYETRIEAAVRAFRNHQAGVRPDQERTCLPRVPVVSRNLEGQSLLVPAWDTLASPLFVAGLQETGVDAHLIHEDPELVQQSLGTNTGQCVPLNIIVHEFVESVKRLKLDPAKCSLWMPDSSLGCNICFFPQYGKALLESYGDGFEKAAVYNGETSAIEVSARAALNAYYAYLFGGMLRRMQCRVRPYEVRVGETDRAVAEALADFQKAILGDMPKKKAVQDVVERFVGIEVEDGPRHKVALFGDLYTRDNDVVNQDLVRVIEAHGGEVITTPYTEYARIIAKPYLRKWLREGLYRDVIMSAPFVYGMNLLERPFRKEFARVLGDQRIVPPQRPPEEILARFHVRMHHSGESFDNLLKIFHLVESHPDLALFVQTNPAFCCPSLVTEAMAGQIEHETGVPVVTITYDGTVAPKNDVVIPYLELAEHGGRKERTTPHLVTVP